MLPPATSYHRLPIRAINGAIQGLNTIGIANIALDENTLFKMARQATGLRDFGDERFIPNMRELLRSLENEADLNPVGRLLTRQSLVRILKHRLLANELLNKHPEILEREMPSPVVVMGLGRSGTTRLHRLLATDPRFLHLKAWESVNPVPLPDSFAARSNGAVDPRISGIEKGLKAVLYLSPQIASVHPLGAHEVEEELGLLQHGFAGQLFEIQAHVPSFAQWLIDNDQSHSYEYMQTLMKIINWYRNDPQDKPWILKSPHHMEDFAFLLKVFPQAKFVFTHRDPVKVMGSLCSLVWHSIVRDSNHVDPHWVGQEWYDKVDHMLVKTHALRDSVVHPDRQFDILYADIHADWRAAMQRIYTFLDLPCTEETLTGMQRWLDGNAQHKHGAHQYDLADFGLSQQQVDERFKAYRERFDIPYEVRPAQ